MKMKEMVISEESISYCPLSLISEKCDIERELWREAVKASAILSAGGRNLRKNFVTPEQKSL